MSIAQAVPFDPARAWPQILIGALFRPRALFGSLQAGPVGPAAALTIACMAWPAVAAVLTDDELYLGHVPRVLARGLMLWVFGTVWLLGPQAALFRLGMRLFGARQPISLAQRGMAAFAVLLAVFGVIICIAGTRPESAPFVIVWYLALTAVFGLGTYALYALAEAFGLRGWKALAAVIAFEAIHGIALVIALGVLFTLVSP
ncbi:MAG TPA: hypothetical protein VFX59_10425 [Polyangiales bacterium]|nr:hypothetical protein [Polyangiales bacterium]